MMTVSLYRRHHETVRIETRHAALDSNYFLTCCHTDGTSHVETFNTDERLYDRLRSLGQQLSCDGWILLPQERRSGNRLPIPLCSACGSTEAVEVLARTDVIVYFGCATCGATWCVPKPGGLRRR